MKKLIAGLSAAVLAVSALGSSLPAARVTAAGDYNYAEALQKSMFFYEVQQAGVLPDWNMVSWRGDSMENDFVPGGWFDAGDHFKFALTNAYSAAVLAWGVMQYEDALKKAGLYDLYMNNLQWGLDYVAGCDLGDSVVGTIGPDGFDHTWWGSAEVYMRKYKLQSGNDERPYDTITCTSTIAQMAAAMAAGAVVFKEKDPTLAANYLKHAESLFNLADSTRSNEEQGVQKSYYNASDFYDDLFYAANWMYMATGEQSYLDKCESDYIPHFPLENQSNDRKYTWGFCWDDSSQGAALLYAINTGKEEWKNQVFKHLEYWTTGYGGKKVDYTPDGAAWLFQWGSLRHSTTTAFLAKVACDTIFADDAEKTEKYNKWAKEQLDYCFGDNDLGMSYVQGMGEKNPLTFHHRTSSGIHDDHWQSLGLPEDKAEGFQTEYAHVLYGALEGGPDKDGSFTDEVGAYQYTEVAIDYNAGYTGLLCAMVDDYGGSPLADFPPTEKPKWNEFEISAVVQQNQSSYTQIQLWAMNHTAWPARVVKDLSYNYYFDITEVLAAGLKPEDITVSINYDQHGSDEGQLSVSGPFQYDGNIYYIKCAFADGRVVMPTGQSEHRAEAQIRIAIPDAVNGQSTAGAWDPTNDYSFQGLQEGGQDLLKSKDAITPYITMYDGDKLIWGVEPDGTVPDDAPTTKPAVTTTVPKETTTLAQETTTKESTTIQSETKPEETTTTQKQTTTTVTSVSSSDSDPNAGGDGTTTMAHKETQEVEPTVDTRDVLYGDVNVDGIVDITDAVYFNKALADVVHLSDQSWLNADVDNSKELTPTDSINILRFIVQTIKSLPV